MAKKVYIIENLDCANCAAKIESKINALEQVQEATITFSTKQLRVTAEDPDALLPEMTKIARSIEHSAVIYPRDKAPKHPRREHSHHEHSEHCGCGHDHHHEHLHDHECGCGHEHHHDHECSCGHDHHHEHHHDHECGCGHAHDHHQKEYTEKGNIRRHAQTIACKDCGPRLRYVAMQGTVEMDTNDVQHFLQ
ncbi:MAG: cation transporter, partial [Oscillospiraceae bacterium]|nr:cation transporter [Oscillospiraceae bacterium]